MTWEQRGHLRKGSGAQNGNASSLVRIDQDSTQFSGTNCGGGGDGDDGDDGDDDDGGSCEPDFTGDQTTVLTADATTTGECVASLTATQNGETETANEPGNTPGSGDTCEEFIACGTTDLTPGEDDFVLLALPPARVLWESDPCISSDDPEID